MNLEKSVRTETLAPQSGKAFRLKKGQFLKVIDPEGEQVSDLFCFSDDGLKDALSSGRSIDYNETIYLSVGHKLYANSGNVMLTIIEDTCGRHDFLVTPCSLQMFQMINGTVDYHPSCLENLSDPLKEFGINENSITTTFNIFMNVPVAENGKISVLPPKSRPGDYIIFKAEIDLIVGLTACSDEGTNNGCCKPISFEIF